MNDNSHKSFLRNYYLTCSLYDFVFAYAIYNLLFSRRGLSIFQISLLLSWWALTALIFEIPSGAFADYWSRKGLLVIAPLIKALCFLTWFFAAGNFYLYALGFIFWSVGSSLVSGTSEALLYDHLTSVGKQSDYERTLSRKKFYYYIALALSMITGGFMAHYNLGWAIIFSVFPLALSAFFASFLKDAPRTESTAAMRYLDHIRLAFKEMKTNRLLVFFLIYILGISMFGVIEEFDQLYYDVTRLPVFAFGMASFICSALCAIGSFHAYRLKGKTWIFYALPIASAGLLVLVGLFPSIPMIGLLLLSYFITSPVLVLIEGKIQHSIEGVNRATITSVGRSMMNLFAVVLMPVFGLISRVWNLQTIYFSTGLLLLVFSAWAFRERRMFEISEQEVLGRIDSSL